MKKLLFLLSVLLLSSKAFSATLITEYFDRNVFQRLDTAGADSEVIRYSGNNSSAGLSTKFNWGAFHNGTSGTIAYGASGALQFNTSAPVLGSFAYTRFDTTAWTEAAATTNHFDNSYGLTLDAANGAAVLDIMSNTAPDVKFGLLLHTGGSWYESSPFSIGTGQRTVDVSISPLTWTTVLPGDIDDADNKGESSLTYGAAATPTLSACDGMGLVVKEPTTANGYAVQVDSITIGQVPKPAGLTAVASQYPATNVDLSWSAINDSNRPVTGYAVYRATTTGGPYTKLTAAGFTGTSYTDATATPGTTFYYVVRGTYDNATANKPAYTLASSEVQAMVTKPFTAAQRWTMFK